MLEMLESGFGDVAVVEFVPLGLGVAGVGYVVAVVHAVSRVHHRGVEVVGDVVLGEDREFYRLVVDDLAAELRAEAAFRVVPGGKD